MKKESCVDGSAYELSAVDNASNPAVFSGQSEVDLRPNVGRVRNQVPSLFSIATVAQFYSINRKNFESKKLEKYCKRYFKSKWDLAN
jgi:hypothetical protein